MTYLAELILSLFFVFKRRYTPFFFSLRSFALSATFFLKSRLRLPYSFFRFLPEFHMTAIKRNAIPITNSINCVSSERELNMGLLLTNV